MARVSLILIDAAQAYAQIVGYVFRTYYRDSIALAGLAHDGASALDLARAACPEIALLDFHDPGIALLSELRAALGHDRIIVLGSDADAEYRTMALAHGAAAYLPKSAINTCLLPVAGRLLGDHLRAPAPLPLDTQFA